MTTRTKKVTTVKFRVRIVVEKDEPGYHAFAPSLKGIHTSGDTPEEAVRCAKEAAEVYLLSMLKHVDPIPIEVLEPGEWRQLPDQEIVGSSVEEIRIDP